MEHNHIPFHLGNRLILQLRHYSQRVTANLIGLEKGKYIILSIVSLSSPDVNTYFKQGKTLVVRYIHEGAALGFESIVTGLIIQPYRLVFIKYPDKIENLNLRKHPRINCYLPAELMIDNKSSNGFILDISLGGCGFCNKTKNEFDPDSLNIGNLTLLKFPIPGKEGKLLIKSIIRSVHFENAEVFFGLEFIEFNKEQKNRLFAYINELQLLEEGG